MLYLFYLHTLACLSIAGSFRELSAEATSGWQCQFPVSWRGRYYQHGLGEVVIREQLITSKGACIQQSADFFFIESRSCNLCLLMIWQHENIIQYKESYCMESKEMKVVCGGIRIETPLYTLIREPAVAQQCPFHETTFRFSYTEMTSEFCDDDVSLTSEARPCIARSKYKMSFKHCNSDTIYSGKTLDLTCLATWKQGSETFMYGRLGGPGLNTKDEKYRCFIYSTTYSGQMLVGMSADGSCGGLNSPTEAPLLFRFDRDNSTRPPASCRLPDWLAGDTWRDLIGHRIFRLDSSHESISEYYRAASSGPRGGLRPRAKSGVHQGDLGGRMEVDRGSEKEDLEGVEEELIRKTEYRCIWSAVQQIGNTEQFSFTSSTLHSCSTQQHCVRIRKISRSVIQLIIGRLSRIGSSYEGCTIDSQPISLLLLAETGMTYSPCPLPGLYALDQGPTVTSSSGVTSYCSQWLSVGCHENGGALVDLSDACSGSPVDSSQSQHAMRCVSSWKDELMTCSLVQRISTGSVHCMCFLLTDDDSAIIFDDENCSDNGTGLGSNSGRRTQVIYNVNSRQSCDGSITTLYRKSEQRHVPDVTVASTHLNTHEDGLNSHENHVNINEDRVNSHEQNDKNRIINYNRSSSHFEPRPSMVDVDYREEGLEDGEPEGDLTSSGQSGSDAVQYDAKNDRNFEEPSRHLVASNPSAKDERTFEELPRHVTASNPIQDLDLVASLDRSIQQKSASQASRVEMSSSASTHVQYSGLLLTVSAQVVCQILQISKRLQDWSSVFLVPLIFSVLVFR